MKSRSRRLAGVIAGGAVSVTVFVATMAIPAAQSADGDSWGAERATREADLAAYLKAHDKEFQSFKGAALASKQSSFNLVGIPMVMFRLLPEIFPDIWGKPADMMIGAGLGTDPWNPQSILPLGIGYLPSQPFDILGGTELVINYATMTCMACHGGPVTGPDGKLMRVIGAPTTTSTLFFQYVTKTVNDPRYSADAFRKALAAKPAGWVYGGDPAMAKQEQFERDLFNSAAGGFFLTEELKAFGRGAAKRFAETAGVYTYAVPGAPPFGKVPGSLDVFTGTAVTETDPGKMSADELKAALPLLPGPADIQGAWMQSHRTASQWDNSFSLTLYREVGASLTASAGDPGSINRDNVLLASDFVQNLPPAPYPFPVDAAKAMAGKALFEAACQGCHHPNNSRLWPAAEVGTDPNRLDAINNFVLTGLTKQLRAACTMPACLAPGGGPLPDGEVFRGTGGYVALPLDGLWATAPYLHNGSVPTLAALLTGDRPAKFYRGNTTYDQVNVGFVWDKAESSTAFLLDTSLSGYSNAGHSGPAFNGGIDWAKEPEKLQELLEYLKTL